MDTTDRTLLIILTVLLSIFFILCIAVVVIVIKLLGLLKQFVARADEVLASVEHVADSAGDVFRQTSNRKALITTLKTIYKLAQKGKK